jgi:small redox-active disulfide protein 2
MKIQVLGSGCSTCKKLFELTQKAVKELSLKDEVEYVTDVQKIVEIGVMQSPVLAVDGKPVMVGFVPSTDTIKDAIKQTMDNKKSGCCQSPDCKCDGNCC